MLDRFKDRAGLAALTVSVVALVAAIGGVAGALPGKNTVNSGDVKKNSLKSVDLKNDGVTGADVKESTLKIPTGALPPGSGATIGVSAGGDGGTLTKSTLPGVTLQKEADRITYTFPRTVSNCVPVVWPTQDGTIRTSPLGGQNQIVLDQGGGSGDHNMIVVCPD